MVRDLAIDLGTANTLVFAKGRGIVLNEPTVLAMDERNGRVLAMGREAGEMIGRTPGHVIAVRPLRKGSITDFDLTERLLRFVFQKIGASRLLQPRAVIAVSSASTTVERRAIEEAAVSAGARSVRLIDEPMAAAMGAELPIDQPTGNCIIDVGGGTTEVAVVSMGSVVAARAIRVGGFDMDDAIQRYLRTAHGIAVGEGTAETIKHQVGSAFPLADEPVAEIRGRDLTTGGLLSVRVGAEEVRAALDACIVAVIDAVRATLAETPPELGHDVIERGLTLTGGGTLLRGLTERISDETTIKVHLAASPLETVVRGAALAMNAPERLRQLG